MSSWSTRNTARPGVVEPSIDDRRYDALRDPHAFDFRTFSWPKPTPSASAVPFRARGAPSHTARPFSQPTRAVGFLLRFAGRPGHGPARLSRVVAAGLVGTDQLLRAVDRVKARALVWAYTLTLRERARAYRGMLDEGERDRLFTEITALARTRYVWARRAHR